MAKSTTTIEITVDDATGQATSVSVTQNNYTAVLAAEGHAEIIGSLMSALDAALLHGKDANAPADEVDEGPATTV